MYIKKMTLLLLLASYPVVANQMCIPADYTIFERKPVTTRTMEQAEEQYNEEGLVEFEDIDVNEQLNTTDLVPWWVPILSRVSARFFVIYHKMCKFFSGPRSKYIART